MPSLIDARRMTTEETARAIGVTPKTLADWRCERPRRGPVPMHTGRRVWYFADDVEAFLREEREKSYANQKAGGQSTMLALPIRNAGKRVRRFDGPTGYSTKPQSGAEN